MDGSSVTRPPASPTRAIVADKAFCRQAAVVLLCDEGPIRDVFFIGEPVEEVLEMVRRALKHEGDEGFDARGQGAAQNWARRRGRGAWRANTREMLPPTATRGPRVAAHDAEVHHAAPRSRCLVSLYGRDNGLPLDGEGIQAWPEWEWEATRWRGPVEISREELEAPDPGRPRGGEGAQMRRRCFGRPGSAAGRRGGQGCPQRCGGWCSTSVGDRDGSPYRTGSRNAPGFRNHLGAGDGPLAYVARHASGDWGDLCAHDRRENGLVLRHGWRVLSSYGMGEGRVWVITEADRSVTTILLPEDSL